LVSEPENVSVGLAEFTYTTKPPPSSDEDPVATKLRKRLQDLLTELRTNAEGIRKSD
ncbi:uncharacterized protein PHACADRAFT_136196, partial [Phanerochaete carnosa HHB-10118-sp]